MSFFTIKHPTDGFSPVKQVYVDPRIDIAIVQINPKLIPIEAKEAKLKCDGKVPSGSSVAAFGHPKDLFHAGEPSLFELANMLEKPLQNLLIADILPDDPKNINASDAVRILSEQVNSSMAGINVEVMLSDGIVSDAAAGANNIKLNQDVKFSQRELDILEVHEGWIHVGTTQNGLAQPYLTCLSKGTPSSTVTQEGLAVLTEIITLKSTPRRLSKLVNRIQAVTKVIDGAEFVDIYRDYLAQGLSKDESYTLAQRVLSLIHI